MCLYPRFVLNPKYKPNKKNGGIIPAVTDIRVLYVPIGCSKCIECKKRKSNEFKSRLMEDIKTYKNARFITLTFNEEKLETIEQECDIKTGLQGYDKENWSATRAVRLFLERWRKQFGKSLRHWLVTELGHKNTERIHLHGLLYCNDFITDKKGKTWFYKDAVKNNWQNGYIYFGDYVNERTINYIVKYITKVDAQHKTYEPIMLTSAGIGGQYHKTPQARLNKFQNEETREYYITRQGIKAAIPPYWKNKLYTDEQKEQLWLQRLDKQERFVLGTKIDVSKNMKEYFSALEEARKKNIRLGYGSYHKDEQQQEYEKQLRIIKQETRKMNNNNKKNKDEQP